MKDIGGCPSTWAENTSICLWGVSLPELLSRLSNYCLTRRRAQCTPTLYHNTCLESPPPPGWTPKQHPALLRSKITLLLTLTPSPSQHHLRCWSLWGRGVMGRELRELEGGLAYPDSGLHFVTDLFCDMEQVVQPPRASVHSRRASAAPSAFKTSFNVWQGVGPSPALQLVKAKRKNTSISVPTQDGPIFLIFRTSLLFHLQAFAPCLLPGMPFFLLRLMNSALKARSKWHLFDEAFLDHPSPPHRASRAPSNTLCLLLSHSKMVWGSFFPNYALSFCSYMAM